MLTHAVDFVLDAELICFALILAVMAWQDRSNRALRWLALAYVSGLCGALLDYSSLWLHGWAAPGLALAAAPIGYACLYTSVTEAVSLARPSRWLAAAIVALSFPWLLLWSQAGRWNAASTLGDAVLALLTAMAVALLLAAREPVTRAPRLTMATFLAAYSAVEFARVAVYVATARMPSSVTPNLEIASGFVYVVSCAALPLAFIWIMNARLHADLLRQASTDPLTGLPNRRALEALCARALATDPSALALALLDLDHFKSINDELGHPAGDAALVQIADFFAHRLRPGETLGRLGGEEFLLLLPGPPSGALARLDQFRHDLAAYPLHLNGIPRHISFSAGLALAAPPHAASWSELLRRADHALYAAKRAGRNRSHLFTPASAASAP